MGDIDLKNKVWIIADTHFGHDKIIEYCGRPANHEELILENWKNMVGSTDVVIHLGDVMLGKSEVSLKNLPGFKILKKGNHDDLDITGYHDAYYDMGFNIVLKHEGVLSAEKNGHKLAFTHEPLIFHTHDLNIHGHLHNLAKLESVCRHYLVALEFTNYKPVLLDDILEEVFNTPIVEDNHPFFNKKGDRLDWSKCAKNAADNSILVENFVRAYFSTR